MATLESILKDAEKNGFMLHTFRQLDTNIWHCNFRAKFGDEKGQPFFWFGGSEEHADPVICMRNALKYAIDGCPSDPVESNVRAPMPSTKAAVVVDIPVFPFSDAELFGGAEPTGGLFD